MPFCVILLGTDTGLGDTHVIRKSLRAQSAKGLWSSRSHHGRMGWIKRVRFLPFRTQLMLLLLSVSVPPLVLLTLIDVWTLGNFADTIAMRFQLSMEQLRQEARVLRSLIIIDLLGAMAIAMIVVGLAGWWVGRLDRRIRPLIDMVQRAGRGDLHVDRHVMDSYGVGRGSQESSRPLRDGLSLLGRSLVKMVEALRQHERLVSSLSLARNVHHSLLPAMPCRVGDYHVAARSDSCDFLGGDYYDIVGHMAVIADICGHGAGAALLASRTQGLLRSVHHGKEEDVMGSVNRHLCEDVKDFTFLSMMAVFLEESHVTYCNAGHPPALLYRGRYDEALWLEGEDLLVGVRPDWQYRYHALPPMTQDDVLVLVTDGVYEAKNKKGAFYGRKNLLACVREHARHDVMALQQSLFQSIKGYQGEQEDDITLMVIRRV